MKKCPICGKDVPPRYGARESVYCSRACLKAHYDAAWETITCPVCGKEFRAKKLFRRKHCSYPCANAAQKGRKITSEAFQEACKHRGVPGPRKHPRTGKFETNCHAKIWLLESPDGEKVTARNLKLYMIDRYGEEKGKKVYKLLVCAAQRFRKCGHGSGAGWRVLAAPASRRNKKGQPRRTALFKGMSVSARADLVIVLIHSPGG